MGRGKDRQAAWTESYDAYGSWPRESWHSKAAGKGKAAQPRKPRESQQETVAFPSFASMTAAPKERASGSRNATAGEAGEDGALDKLDMVKAVQKLVNGVRKAEVRIRKGTEELDSLTKKWEAFQVEMKQAFVRERAKFVDMTNKQREEIEEQQQLRDEALTELQTALTTGAVKRKAAHPVTDSREAEAEWDKILGDTEDADEDLSSMLAGAMVGSGRLGASKVEEMLRLIAAHRRRARTPTTPARRRARQGDITPPRPTRVTRDTEEPGGDNAAATEDNYTGKGVLLDPYVTSPSTRGPPPLRSTSTSRPRPKPCTSVKDKGKEPVVPTTGSPKLSEKLEAARAEELRKSTEVVDSDDENGMIAELSVAATQREEE